MKKGKTLYQLSLAALLLALVALSLLPASATEDGDVNPDVSGVASVRCFHSHVNRDDPIVFPNQQGASHQHSYMGSKTTKYDSSVSSMKASATSCEFSKDTAGYWFPSLKKKSGVTVNPTEAFFYYREQPDGERIHPFPSGLKVVAGYPKISTGGGRLHWKCRSPNATHHSTIPNCPGDGAVVAVIGFPTCWNGTKLDSADHRSHMSYVVSGKCPSTHPIRVPNLAYHIHWPVVDAKTAGYKLSSDGSKTPGSTLHADFWNTWDQPTLNRVVQKCLVENVDIPESTKDPGCRNLKD